MFLTKLLWNYNFTSKKKKPIEKMAQSGRPNMIWPPQWLTFGSGEPFLPKALEVADQL
jgi:hypothetical protein